MKSDRKGLLAVALLGIGENRTSHGEKLISGVGALLGILLVHAVSSWYLGPRGGLLMVASMGATAVLLFAVPQGALSQPWAVLGGHGVSAAIGVSCHSLLPDSLLAPSLAVGLSVAAMHYLRCIHPPGGATALTAVLGGEPIHELGYLYLLTPVLLNLICLLLMAVVFNACFAWRRYPAVLARRRGPSATPSKEQYRGMLSHEDLAAAMEKLDSCIDVTSEELAELFDLAVEHAAQTPKQVGALQVGGCYSNGQPGTRWAIRQVVDDSVEATGCIRFKTVAGRGIGETGSCPPGEFRAWARFPVHFTGERWVRCRP